MDLDCPPSCPFVLPEREALAFPLGQIHRLGSAERSGQPVEVDETKRNVLKLLAVAGVLGAAGGGLVGGTLQYVQPPIVGATSYPRVQLLDVDQTPLTATKATRSYNVTTPDLLLFNYPLRNEPNFFLNLAPPSGGSGGATNVPGGIGPNKSIVAFSAICQHLGCPAPALSFYPPGYCPQTPGGRDFYFHCTCHGSTYDAANAAANLTGPAVLPLPQVTLEWQSSDDTIWATGVVGPPVNGHIDTLQGDYPVASSVAIQKQSATRSCDWQA